MNSGRQFVIFVFCGGLAACANLGSRWLFSHWLPYAPAIVLAYLVGMLTGYLLFKFFVFSGAHSRRVLRECLWYVLVNVLALAQTLLISLLLARWLFPGIGMTHHGEDIAHLFGVAVPVFTSYLGHKYFTFKKMAIP